MRRPSLDIYADPARSHQARPVRIARVAGAPPVVPSRLALVPPSPAEHPDRPPPISAAPRAPRLEVSSAPLTGTTIQSATTPSKTSAAPDHTECEILAVLDAPANVGEAAEAAFRRKERELGAVFATLTTLESRALHTRLSNPKPDDAMAMRFVRLVADRRARLLAFLADARRREAIAMARR
jgi:hypothetical protein